MLLHNTILFRQFKSFLIGCIPVLNSLGTGIYTHNLRRMKQYIKWTLVLCLTLIINALHGQDMSGEWNGILRQSEGGAADAYYFVLNIKQNGTKITGTSRVSFVEQPEFYAIMELQGTFKDDILMLTETKIIEEKTYEGLDWCIKKAKLEFTFKKDGFCIEGTWAGQTLSGLSCSPGTIKMCKIVPIAFNKTTNSRTKPLFYDKSIFSRRA